MANYIELKTEDFKEIFNSLRLNYQEFDNPRSGEIQFKVKTEHPIISVMIHSSVDKKMGVTRGVGEDAIRLVFWSDRNNRPLGKGKRIYRVTSAKSISDRISKTVKEFLAKAPNESLTDWRYIKAILKETKRTSTNSTFATNLLEGLKK